MVAYVITGVVLLVYLVLVWFIGIWMHMHGAALWALRGLLALFGLVGAGTFIWFYRQNRGGISADAGGASADEIDYRMREGLQRLRAITRNGRDHFGDHPLVLMMGAPGSTKTSIIENSSLDPDLLSGNVEQDGGVVPTSSVNLFYTKQSVFVDVGGSMLSVEGAVRRILARLQPNNFSRAVRSGQAAPRSALLCVDCETLRQGAQAAQSVARKLNAALHEAAQVLGTDFPVYVVFTKLDRVPGFTEYMRNFTKEEAGQVLGTTLPLRRSGAGVYADEETKRLSSRFDEIFCSLAEKRTYVLARENDATKLAPVYEFPREIRKLRATLVQMLVDLCRPSQMPSNPFLRGFYFCGVRPLIVEEVVHSAVERPVAGDAGSRGATRMFNFESMAAAASAAPQPVSTVRKIPQWAFVAHLFMDVVLRDRNVAATGVSANVSVIRRILLVAASVIGVIAITLFAVSFFSNRAMEKTVVETAQAMPAAPSTEVPALADLQKLDTIRDTVATLEQYRTDGPPWYMRFGLYTGDDLYAEARAVYFVKFRLLLFGATQVKLLTELQTLPPAPDPARDYGVVYDTLKAYLITTTNHEKSTKEFLQPVLYQHFAAGRDIDSDREKLIRTQFDFYATELKAADPYDNTGDSAAVGRGRAYLKNFADSDRYYRAILSDASAKAAALNFNRQFAGSAEVLLNNRDVPGAFTKVGYGIVQDDLRNLEKHLQGEDWVLGSEAAAIADAPKLRAELSDRYKKDFLNYWREFMKNSTLLQFHSLQDATAKLNRLAAPTSPMLELFSMASRNTAVDDSSLASAFQPVQTVVKPDGPPDQYIQPGNQSYATALANLQQAIVVVQNSPGGLQDANAVGQAITVATSGAAAVQQMAQGFRVDPDGHIETVSSRLLSQPFEAAITLLRGASVIGMNQAAASFCSAYDQLMRKFPMNPNAREEATLDEFNNLFAPGKQFWQMYDANFSKVLLPQGSMYVATNTGTAHITPEFQRFFNTVADFSHAFYPGSSPQPRVAYTLTQSPQNNVNGLSITIDGDTLAGSGQRKQFTWPGSGQGLRLTSAAGDLASFTGTWAIYRFLAAAHWSKSGAGTLLEYPFGAAGQTPLSPKYELDGGGAFELQRRLAATRCVRVAAR